VRSFYGPDARERCAIGAGGRRGRWFANGRGEGGEK
jgi:hypothetical protein